jgi:hypothetical protein
MSWLRSMWTRVRSRGSVDSRDDAGANEPQNDAAAPVIRPNRLVPKGFRYLRADAVLELERFQRADGPERWDPNLFHPSDRPPPLPLFISHRWESHDHPDPRGSQLRALQSLLRSIREVFESRAAGPAERVRRVPSLRVHGLFQAALIIGASDDADDEDNTWRDWSPVIHAKGNVDPLQHIGIWYDYTCMLQAAGERGDEEVRTALAQLPDLVRACPIVILRSKGDRYSERGWCAAEVAAARRDYSLIVLRTDLLGSPIPSSDLFAPSNDALAAEFELRFIESALDDWESKTAATPHLRGLFIGLPGLKPAEESRQAPLFTTGRNPDAFPQQKGLLLYFIQALGQLSELDAREGRLRDPYDLGLAIRDAMRKVELYCSEERDVVFVGLSIMRSRHHPKLVPTVERFYREATVRWLRGESIRLTRFRARRPDPMHWEFWYLFEGEDASARRKPRWVK